MAAIAEAPVVVGGTHRSEQFRVDEFLAEDLPAHGGIEHLGVHSVAIHIRDPNLRPEALGSGLLVLFHAACGCLQELRRVHRVVAILFGDWLSLDAHADVTVAHVTDPRRSVGKRGIDVVRPHSRRFHLMCVCIQDAVPVAHRIPLAFLRCGHLYS